MCPSRLQSAPLADEALESSVEWQAFHFTHSKPSQLPAFSARRVQRAFRSDQDVPHIVVQMCRLILTGRDLVYIEIERTGCSDNQSFDAALLERLPLRDPQHVFITIAVAAELQPAVQLPVMMQQGARAIGI